MNDGEPQGVIGPSNWVDPVTYRRLTRGIGTRKRRTKKKTTTRARKGGYPVWAPTGNVAGIMGRGDYWSDFKNVASRAYNGVRGITPAGTFSKIGAGIGGAFGHPILGASAGNLVSKILGWGDYAIQNNSLMNMGTPVAQFGNMSQGVIVAHREFICDVVAPGTAAFTNTSYPINPGLVASFPWLAPIANQFDQYEIIGLIYEFKSTSSDYATGTALGSIIMATEYDSADPVYSSKIEMENSQYCISTKPSLDAIHPVECDPSVNLTPRMFTRSTTVPVTKDQRLYDHGVFQLATVGNAAAANTVMGELWVSYQIAFFKPQITGNGGISDHFTNNVAVSAAAYFGTAGTGTVSNLLAKSGSNLGGSVLTSTYTFPATVSDGIYLVQYNIYGGSATITTALAIGTLVGCSAYAIQLNDSSSTITAPEAGSATQTATTITRTLQVTAKSATFTISAGTVPAATCTMDLWVTRLPYGLLT